MKTYRITERAVLLSCALMMAAGILLGYTLGFRFPFRAQKDLWDVLTSAGTVGAVIVALWQSQRIRNDKSKEALQRAHIVGAMRFVAVHDLANDLKHMQERCSTYLEVMPDSHALFETDTFRALDHPMLGQSVEELLALYELDRKRTVRFASTLSALRQHGRRVRSLREKRLWDRMEPAARCRLLTMWHKLSVNERAEVEAMRDALDAIFKAY